MNPIYPNYRPVFCGHALTPRHLSVTTVAGLLRVYGGHVLHTPAMEDPP